MMKKLLSFLLCILLLLGISANASAAQDRVVDEAGLLTDSERNALEEKAASLWDSCHLDVAIVTLDSTYGKSVQTYADDYYDEHGYGYGADNSGILLLLCMDTREWYISTCGEAIYIFTDFGLEQMGQAMLADLSYGEYFDAFETWMDLIPEYVEAFSQGQPIDGMVYPDEYEPIGGDEIIYYEKDSKPNHFISLLIGAAVAGIALLIMRSGMNTAKQQANAADYVKNGSFRLNLQRDMFLYRQVSKTPKAQSQGTRSGGGGSSVHRSSGGVSHGGRGGRF